MSIPISDNQVVPLFAVPLCKTRIEPCTEQEMEYLTTGIDYKERLHSIAWNSVDNYILDDPKVADVKRKVMEQVNEFLLGYLDVDPKHEFYMTTSWMNRYQKNHYAQMHYHSNSLISGVLYLTDCEETADIVFHKDKSNTNIFTLTLLEKSLCLTNKILRNLLSKSSWKIEMSIMLWGDDLLISLVIEVGLVAPTKTKVIMGI